jgi:two-component system NtrC family response regulator
MMAEDPTSHPVSSKADSRDPTPRSRHPLSKFKLLIIEDEEAIRTQMRWALAENYHVLLAENRMSAIDVFKKEKPPVVTLDLGLPPRPAGIEEGFLTLNEMVSLDPYIKVVVITGRGEKEHAIQAISQGAYDFFMKPVLIEELRIVLGRAFYLSQLEKEHRDLKRHLLDESFEGMIGTSPQMEKVYASIRKVSTTDVPVLIVGESGTGKELVAQAIHKRSLRKDGPFVVINCGAIPEALLESELFGHEKGSFTGAHIQRKGRIEAAQDGTLFLDEVGELTPPLQVKLLRYLQEQKIERIGGREEITVNARVLAATNMDLKKATSDGRFREDLYYRIGVVVISMPPLREREGDIRLLAQALLHKYTAERKPKISGFTSDALQVLENHAWPGNVRELENRIKRAVIMAEGGKILPEDLELVAPRKKHGAQTLKETREALERDLILRAMGNNNNNLSRVAAELGISRPTLYELMEKLGIRRDADHGSKNGSSDHGADR